MPKTLKQIRENVIKNLEISNRLKKQAYEKYYDILKPDQDELIYVSSEELKTLKINERVSVSPDVEFLKIEEDADKMVFHTMMIEGGQFSEHFHDWIEIVEVLQGELIERQKGNRKSINVVKKGERVIYDKGEKHSMYVNEYTLLKVTFLRDII